MSNITDAVRQAQLQQEQILQYDYFLLLSKRDAWEQRSIQAKDYYNPKRKEEIRKATIQDLDDIIKEVSQKLRALDTELRPPFQMRQRKACPTQHLKEIY